MNVAELLDTLVSLPTLLLAILVYGFAPGFLLRLLVLVYQRNDSRRAELIAELYEVPRLRRPFWVAEQIETAIFDGVVPRVRWALTGRIILRWRLGSGVQRNRQFPDSFWIPSAEEKDTIEPGDVVKLMFEQSDGWVERMWVSVEKIGRRRWVGTLDSQPRDFPRLYPGRKIRFRPEHIIDYDVDPYTQTVERRHTTSCVDCMGVNGSDALATRETEDNSGQPKTD